MDNTPAYKQKKIRTALKIVVLVLIICVIATIFIFKNAEKKTVNKNPESQLTITEIKLEELAVHGLPIIIDFGADYCPPCREMAPTLAKLHNELQGKAIIHYIDISQSQDIAKKFPVRVIPTQVFYSPDGKPYVPSKDFNAAQFTVYSAKDTNEHVFTIHEGGLTETQLLAILADMGMVR